MTNPGVIFKGRRGLILACDGLVTQCGQPMSHEGYPNYIRNSIIFEDITGFNRYDDSGGGSPERPTDGTGGTPNAAFTCTRNTTSPLGFEADLQIYKDANNRQGYGVSFDFQIKPCDQGKRHRIAMDYSGSGVTWSDIENTDSDIIAVLYDITNGTLIDFPDTDTIVFNGDGYFESTFFAAQDSVNYRLCLHVATTNASAWTFNATNIHIGRFPTAFDSVKCMIYLGNAASHTASGATQIVPFDTLGYDTHSMADLVNHKIKIRQPGAYLFLGAARFAANAGGVARGSFSLKNSVFKTVGPIFYPNAAAPSNGSLCFPNAIDCYQGDLIELQGYQDSGGALGYVIGGASCFLTVIRMGDPGGAP